MTLEGGVIRLTAVYETLHTESSQRAHRDKEAKRRELRFSRNKLKSDIHENKFVTESGSHNEEFQWLEGMTQYHNLLLS